MAKNAKPEDQKALQDALKQANEMAKNQPPKPDAKDLRDLAKQLDKMDPKAKEELRKKFERGDEGPEDAGGDTRRWPRRWLSSRRRREEQKQFDDLMNQMGGTSRTTRAPDPADPRNKLKSAELLLEKFKEDRREFEQAARLDQGAEADKWMRRTRRAHDRGPAEAGREGQLADEPDVQAAGRRRPAK